MAIVMKLKYVDELSGGRKRFRRRWPKDVADKRGETVFQKPFSKAIGRAFLLEHEQFMAEFDREVTQQRLTKKERERTSPAKKYRSAKLEAAKLWAGASGDEYGIECALAEHAISIGDDYLYRAILEPNAPEPQKTLADAFDLYIEEKLDSSGGRNARNRIERVKKRLDSAIGNLAEIPLKTLKREHGRALQAHLRSAKKKNGAPLAVATMERELNSIKAVVEFGLMEFDLTASVTNPFRNLELGERGAAPVVQRDARDPLPAHVIEGVRNLLRLESKRTELFHIWRLLEGTGCRPSEVSGLRVSDVRIDHEIPHIVITWHEHRGVKTESSHRSIPLVGDAHTAAVEAVKAAEGQMLLSPHYSGENGPDRLSSILNKHVDRFTDNPNHVPYSLRHNFKNKLMTAGIDSRIENRLMGHSTGNLGDRVYGSEEIWLKLASEALHTAFKL